MGLIQTTASLSELTLSSDDLFNVEMQGQFFEALHSNGQMLRLTKLNLFELMELPENADQVSQLVEFLQFSCELEEIGLENCYLGGYELARIGKAL